MFFKWLVLGKGGVDDVGREPTDSSDNAVAPTHRNVVLDSNYGITVSKKLLDDKHTMLYVPMRHGYWNCIVWAVGRLTPYVINPTLAEY